MAGRGPNADRSHDSRYNFLLAPPLCRSSWCHYSRRLCELEQIGQSARITRPKTLLIWRRLPRPRSRSRSAPENRVGGGPGFPQERQRRSDATEKKTPNHLISDHLKCLQHGNKDRFNVFSRRFPPPASPPSHRRGEPGGVTTHFLLQSCLRKSAFLSLKGNKPVRATPSRGRSVEATLASGKAS